MQVSPSLSRQNRMAAAASAVLTIGATSWPVGMQEFGGIHPRLRNPQTNVIGSLPAIFEFRNGRFYCLVRRPPDQVPHMRQVVKIHHVPADALLHEPLQPGGGRRLDKTDPTSTATFAP